MIITSFSDLDLEAHLGMHHRLFEFLDTQVLNGRKGYMPPLYKDHAVGMGSSHLCVFCYKNTGAFLNEGFIKLEAGTRTSREVKVNCCRKCEAVLYKPEMIYAVNRVQRLKHFIASGHPPPQSNHFSKGGTKANCCIFCERSFGTLTDDGWSTEPKKEYYIPEGSYDRVYGPVTACDRCTQLHNDLKIFIDINYTTVIERCVVDPSHSFKVTNQLHQQRINDNTAGRHVCPECFTREHGTSKLRVLSTRCGGCTDYMELDLSHTDNFPSYINTCKKCRNEMAVPDTVDMIEFMGGKLRVYADLYHGYGDAQDKYYSFIEFIDDDGVAETIYDSSSNGDFDDEAWQSMMHGCIMVETIMREKFGIQELFD